MRFINIIVFYFNFIYSSTFILKVIFLKDVTDHVNDDVIKFDIIFCS